MSQALSFLQSVAGFARAHDLGSPSKPVRLGVVDPAYTGTGYPKVTFEGEDTMSEKEYAFSGTAPAAGDRVALIPVGTTYLIVGSIGGSPLITPVSRGGTGKATVGAGNYLKGAGTSALVEVTPANVRTEIGANNATNLTTGALPPARLSTAIATGSVSITPSAANTPTTVTWTYGATLAGTVHVVATPNTSVPGTTVTGTSVTTPSATSVPVYLTRTNTSLTIVYLAAFGGF